MVTSFWKNKRVVVTGGAGFLGSYVLEGLRRRGVTAMVPRSREYNLVEAEAVKRLYTDARPDIVLHLAAVVGGIGANRENPGKFFYDNLMMGVQLIEEARRSKIEKFVTLGTVCAYPKFTPVPFKEENLWNGYPEETNAPYGIAKKALWVQGVAYRQQYGLNSIFLLPVNLYGPRDNFDPQVSHVIPALIKKVVDAQLSGAQSITCWGDGTPTREFIHAEDAAEGILLATENFNGEEPVNLGSGEEFSIRELVDIIVQESQFKGSVVWDTSKPNGQPRRKLDTQKAEIAFGFRAQKPFRQGLAETLAWYREARREGKVL